MKHDKILFVVSNLGCGGINRSLENLLSIWQNDFDVDVLALDSTGQYHDGFANSSVVRSAFFIDLQVRRLADQRGMIKLLCGFTKTINRITCNFFYLRSIEKLQRRLSHAGYKAAVAFSEGLPTSFVSGLDIGNRIAWIHCDFKSYLSFSPLAKDLEDRKYSGFNHIVCVSDYTRKSFVDVYPHYSEKTCYIYNVLDTEMMKQRSVEFDVKEYDKRKFNIVTVGRIDPVKCPSRIPAIASKITSGDYEWFIIGPTIWQSEYDKLIGEIDKYHLSDRIHLMGPKDNPYPYISQADLLVNTSVSEACPYVINEAKVLGTPVVCTDFGSAREFIENGRNGYSMPVEQVGQCIDRLIADKTKYSEIADNLSKFEYDNAAIIRKFCNLLEMQ